MAITLKVGGMTCNHCVRAVTKALEGVAGVDRVAVDLGAARAEVDGSADPNSLVRALEHEGYEAKLVAAR